MGCDVDPFGREILLPSLAADCAGKTQLEELKADTFSEIG